ncbi:hypothetical protein LLI29_003114 [Morganella morganii]
MKVTVEHNGKTIWCRDSESGTGMTSRGYLTDGTQQKIVTALIDALTQANGEMSLFCPVGEVCLTFSDEQLKGLAEELRTHRVPASPLHIYPDITIDSPKIKVEGSLAPSDKINDNSIERLRLLQGQIEASLEYINSGKCNAPEKVATADLESLLSYHQSKLKCEQGNKENHPIFPWGKWQRHP